MAIFPRFPSTDDLITLLAEKLDVPAQGLTASTAYADLDLDSLVLVELSALLRDRYGIEMDDQQIAELGTIGATAQALTTAATAA